MPGANAQVVQALYGKWSEGDFSGQQPLDEDVDFEVSGWQMLQAGGVKARGSTVLAEVWREVLGAWADFRTGPIEELIEVGDRVVACSRLIARGRETGIEVSAVQLFSLQPGRRGLLVADRDGLRSRGARSEKL